MKNIFCFIILFVVLLLIVMIIFFLKNIKNQKNSDALQNRVNVLLSTNQILGLSYQEIASKIGPASRMYELDLQNRYICEWYLGQRKSGAILFFPYEVYLKIEFENGKSTKAEIINRDTKL